VRERNPDSDQLVYHRGVSAEAMGTPTASRPATGPANRLGLDYAAEARRFPSPPAQIIDVHTHISGVEAARVYRRAATLYGVGLTYSMTQLEHVESIRAILGEHAVRFIAVPAFQAEDRRHALGRGYIERLPKFHALGSRIAKFWSPPRAIDYAREAGDPNLFKLNAPERLEAMQLAQDLGMALMVHVGDPDTWFATKYADASVYGTKREQYDVFEEVLERFRGPWIAAHMGGWPEDLGFIAGLLERHPNLHLDTSATKWMVRELSKHPRERLAQFLERYRGRIMFGSDIVTSDDHLAPSKPGNEMAAKASSTEEAFDLYASRYWALRTLYETEYEDESPIADPDLAMVQPHRFTEMDAPPLIGKSLPRELLRSLYHDSAHDLLEPLHR
jgi:hypothetical protein